MVSRPSRSRIGSPRKRANGRWQGRVLDPDGKTVSQMFNRKTDAERWQMRTIAAMDAGTWEDPSKPKPKGPPTYREFVEQWKQGDTYTRLKPSTQNRYKGILEKHLLPEFGDTLLPDIGREAIQRWVNNLEAQPRGGRDAEGEPLKPATINRMFTVLRGSLLWAVRVGLLEVSPTVGVGSPKANEREMCYLETHEQIAILADAMPPRYRALVYFAAYTGLRFGEIAGLKIGRLDLMRGRVHVEETLTDVDGKLTWGTPKTKRSRRTVGLPEFLRDMLVAHIAEFVDDPTDQEALVFTSAAHRSKNELSLHGMKPLRASGFNKPWKRTVKAALPENLHGLRFHDLRHTAAALLIAQGVHPLAISRRLGHANISVTMDVYGHLLPEVEDDLVAGLDATYRKAQEAADENAGEQGAV